MANKQGIQTIEEARLKERADVDKSTLKHLTDRLIDDRGVVDTSAASAMRRILDEIAPRPS